MCRNSNGGPVDAIAGVCCRWLSPITLTVVYCLLATIISTCAAPIHSGSSQDVNLVLFLLWMELDATGTQACPRSIHIRPPWLVLVFKRQCTSGAHTTPACQWNYWLTASCIWPMMKAMMKPKAGRSAVMQ
jgi:hypothetical protein